MAEPPIGAMEMHTNNYKAMLAEEKEDAAKTKDKRGFIGWFLSEIVS